MFRCNHHHQRAHHLSIARVTIVKISIYAATLPNEPRHCILTHFNNCNFSKAQTVCSLMMAFFTPKHVGAF